MPATLLHSPAHIVQRLIVSLGLGTLPSAAGSWPVYATAEPQDPDNVITVYDTAGQSDGRSMIDGELFEHNGIQVRVRATTHEVGWPKADAIQTGLALSVYDETVTIDGTAYLIHSINRIGQVIPIGKETPLSKRSVFTINALALIRP